MGAHKRFRHYDQSQSFLLPPSLDDWLPEDHDARFISEVVEDMLDLLHLRLLHRGLGRPAL